MIRYLFILIFQFVFIHFCHSQTVIKMEKDGGVNVIPCSINGLALKFVFDTGASTVSISSAEAIFMLKNGYLKSSDFIGEHSYSDAKGEISEGTTINLRELSFAGFTLKNVKATIVHNLKAPLLLGLSAIDKLGKIQIDGMTLTILNGKKSIYDEKSYSNCNSYIRLVFLTRTLPQYKFLYSEKTFLDDSKRIIGIPDFAEMKLITEAKDDEIFSFVCYQGVTGYISKHLLINKSL